VSSGIFGFPKEMCAKVIIDAAAEYCESHPLADPINTLSVIHFTNFDQPTVDVFLNAFKARWPKSSWAGNAIVEHSMCVWNYLIKPLLACLCKNKEALQLSSLLCSFHAVISRVLSHRRSVSWYPLWLTAILLQPLCVCIKISFAKNRKCMRVSSVVAMRNPWASMKAALCSPRRFELDSNALAQSGN